MKENRKVRVADSVRGFTLPRYDEIPNVGLYLEQTAKYISEYLNCLGDFTLTRSMISNYVKKGIIARRTVATSRFTPKRGRRIDTPNFLNRITQQ